MEDQVLMVDVNPLSLRKTPDSACYIPFPFVGELSIPNSSRVIPDVNLDLLSFIYPLAEYNSVSEYLNSSSKPRQLYYEVAKFVQYAQPHWHGIFW